jgi:ACT-domain-containing protein, predicted allosteric regulator of homoserine dehydrogenase
MPAVRVRLTCALVDRPGTLLKTLEQIALAGGNIISIVHSRENIASGYVPVSINVEFPDAQSLERARKGIESVGVPVIGSESLEKSFRTVIVIGRGEFGDLIRAVEGLGLRIVDASVRGSGPETTARLTLEVPEGEGGERAMARFEEVAKGLGYLLLTEV